LDCAEQSINEALKRGQISLEQSNAQKTKIDEYRSRIRRTDEDLGRDQTDIDKPPRSFEYECDVSLPSAVKKASTHPGVYIIYLHGQVMKCGRAAYKDGIHWRFTQYYNLKYDNRAKKGDYWSVSPENRDEITVSWQCCPVSKCKELEYKLFRKYGKGPWALRAPASCAEDTWELLI